MFPHQTPAERLLDQNLSVEGDFEASVTSIRRKGPGRFPSAGGGVVPDPARFVGKAEVEICQRGRGEAGGACDGVLNHM